MKCAALTKPITRLGLFMANPLRFLGRAVLPRSRLRTKYESCVRRNPVTAVNYLTTTGNSVFEPIYRSPARPSLA
jgi:hypothetical protein